MSSRPRTATPIWSWVNTCGFIDAAVEESLSAVGEALSENGKVIVTGCLGARQGGGIRSRGASESARGHRPARAGEVMDVVHAPPPAPHDPFVDLLPPQGVKLTPRHYAYLKISEGCKSSLHVLHHSFDAGRPGQQTARRGDERGGEPLQGGRARAARRVQDTSAYGVDVRYRTGFWRGRADQNTDE